MKPLARILAATGARYTALHAAEELLLGSATKHVLAESQCAVLVIADSRGPRDADGNA